MILSNDHKFVFYSVTKTGSTTMSNLLINNNLGTNIGSLGIHVHRGAFSWEYLKLHPDATAEEINSVDGYAFWRDPIDRYVSASTFARQYPKALMSLFPETFGPGGSHDISERTLPARMNTNAFNALPKRIRDKIAEPGNEEEIFQRVKRIMELNVSLMPQAEWFKYGGVKALNYHDYENEARRLIGMFGGDINMTIPVENPSPPFIPPTPINDTVREWIRELYEEDYWYDPRNPQP